jgi:hypothetical protein
MATTPEPAQDSRSSGISYQQLLKGDAVPPPEVLTLESPLQNAPLQSVPVSRYTTREFHDLEMQRLWPRIWQMACRAEEIPSVGDYLVYEIGQYSIIVVRTAEGIRAHHNVCRHHRRQSAQRHLRLGFSAHRPGQLRSDTRSV